MTSEHAPGRSYIRAVTATEPISPEITRLMARLAGVIVPEEDIQLLTAALGSQLASIAALDELDLTDVNPAVEFDATWS
jgi:hypothetical protein